MFLTVDSGEDTKSNLSGSIIIHLLCRTFKSKHLVCNTIIDWYVIFIVSNWYVGVISNFKSFSFVYYQRWRKAYQTSYERCRWLWCCWCIPNHIYRFLSSLSRLEVLPSPTPISSPLLLPPTSFSFFLSISLSLIQSCCKGINP